MHPSKVQKSLQMDFIIQTHPPKSHVKFKPVTLDASNDWLPDLAVLPYSGKQNSLPSFGDAWYDMVCMHGSEFHSGQIKCDFGVKLFSRGKILSITIP